MERIECVKMGGLFLLASMLASVVYLGICALWMRALNIPVDRYVIGYGPAVLKVNSLTVCAVPLGAYFTPATRTLTPVRSVAAEHRAGARYIEDAPLLSLIGVAVLAPALPFAIAALLIGPARALDAVSSGARSYILGSIAPLARAPAYLDGALHAFQSGAHRSFLGGVAAITAGVNFIWAPSAIMYLLGLTSSRAWLRIRVLLWLAARATEASWMIAFAIWIAGR